MTKAEVASITEAMRDLGVAQFSYEGLSVAFMPTAYLRKTQKGAKDAAPSDGKLDSRRRGMGELIFPGIEPPPNAPGR